MLGSAVFDLFYSMVSFSILIFIEKCLNVYILMKKYILNLFV